MTPLRLAQASFALSLVTAVLAGYIALRPEPTDVSSDLGYISSQLNSLSAEVSDLSFTVDRLPTTASEPTDVSSIETQLGDLADRVELLGNSGFYSVDDVYSRVDDVCNALGNTPPSYEGC